MEDQFAALHENPDMWVFSFLTAPYLRWNCTTVTNNPDVCSSHRIIGTPGRLMHVVQEMNLKLQNVEYVVFDEADRWEHEHRVCIFTTVKNLPAYICQHVFLLHTGFLKWVSLNSFRKSSADSQTADRRCCSRPRCPSYWWSSPEPVLFDHCFCDDSKFGIIFFFFINSRFQNDFVIFQVWLNRCWSVWMWILNSVT